MRKHFFVFTILISLHLTTFSQDVALIDSLKRQVITIQKDTSKATIYYELSKCYWYDFPDSAIYFATISKQLSERNNYFRGIGFADYSIGVSYVWKEDYFNALQFTEKGLTTGKQISDLEIQGYCYLNYGVIYVFQSKYPAALKNFYAALKIGNQLRQKEIQTWTYSNLSSLFYTLNNKEEVARYDSLLFKNAIASGNKRDMAMGYISFGTAFLDASNYVQALKNFKEAQSLMESIGEKNGTATCYCMIGNTLRRQGNYNEALDCFFKELNLYEQTYSEYQMAHIYNEIGLTYIFQNKFKDAYLYLKKSLQYGLTTKNWVTVTEVYNEMVYIDSASGNFKQALANYKLYFLYNDSLKDNERTKKITEQQMQYDFDIKDAANKAEQAKKDVIAMEDAKQQRTIRNASFAGIAVLILFGGFTYNRYVQRKKLSNQLSQSLIELKQTQGQLIQLEKEKEAEAIRLRISRDIHDDIGSNLTKIAMLGNLASAQSKNKMPEMTEQLDKIADYARTVNSSMSEIIWAVNPKQDTLENLLAYMRVHTEEFLKDSGINYKINFPDNIPAIQLNPDLKRSLFLVLKESLNNVVKYAEAKNISVSFQTFETSFEMQIADDGKGFDLSEINSTKGGNGLHNIKNRMGQSGCSLSIQTSPVNGCSVSVKGLLQSI